MLIKSDLLCLLSVDLCELYLDFFFHIKDCLWIKLANMYHSVACEAVSFEKEDFRSNY